MELYYEESGSGEPLVMLHGIFGSLSNLGAISRILESSFHLIRVDLRNHGQSPHADSMSYREMADDVLALLDRCGITRANLFGHSMGGKVAMTLALTHPDRVKKLIVGDIAPVAYPPHHNDALAGLQAIELNNLQSRSDADNKLAEFVEQKSIRQYLLKNLQRDKEGAFSWRLNLNSIVENYDRLREEVGVGSTFGGPTLFIRGELSNYIHPRNNDEIKQKFPQARIETIANTTHWVHAENPQNFAELMMEFLRSK